MPKRKNDPIFLVLLALPVVLFVALCFQLGEGKFANPMDQQPTVLELQGEYRADGGPWLRVDQAHPFVNRRYGSVVFRGQFSSEIPSGQSLILMMRNLWVELRINGTTVATNLVKADGTQAKTPGYAIAYVPSASVPQGSAVELRLRNPYRVYQADPYTQFLSQLRVGTRDALYAQMIDQEGGLLLPCLVLCILIPVMLLCSGVVRKKEPYHFVALLLVVLSAQMYLSKEAIYLYLPLFIPKPVLCTVLDLFTVHFCTIACIYFVLTSLRRRGGRCFMAWVLALAVGGSALSICLQWGGVWDIYPGQMLVYPAMLLCCTGGMFCLYVEAKRWNNDSAKMTLITLAPIFIAGTVELFCAGNGLVPQRQAMRVGVLSAVVTQLFLLLRQARRLKRERDRYHNMEVELVKSQTAIMLSQIQPHFLYNALSAIAQMCEKKPAVAKEAVIAFSEYLRSNMQSLKSKRPIPFGEELRHLANYLKLEQMRFGDELKIVYHIETTDFSIPPLTIQPLVENAVKYGVGMSENGGTVVISSKACLDGVEIVIADDGVGYDPAQVQFDGRSHIGIENVRQRLELMCGGTLTISSVKGTGTTAVIRIPADAKDITR
ncbi:MAG: histidine kinase [Clostridia bacterium]